MELLSDLLPDGITDSQKEYEINDSDTIESEHIDLLDKARNAWDNLQGVREEYIRNRKFYNGDQHSDMVTDPETNKQITESELIVKQGRQPIKNNQIQKIVRNMLGQFRDNDYKPMVMSRQPEKAETTEMMTNSLQYIYDAEELNELDTRAFESFQLHGVPGFKVDWGYNPRLQNYGINVDMMSIHRMFFNTDVEDVRMKDLRMIGEIHDMLPEDVVTTFGKGDKKKEEIIKAWVGGDRSTFGYENDFNSSTLDNMDFYIAEDEDKVRIIEVWCKKKKLQAMCHDFLSGSTYIHSLDPNEAQEAVELENQERIDLYVSEGILDVENMPLIDINMEELDVWHYYFLDVQGHCLAKGETPFEHNEHPYVIRPYPMTDRVVVPFVSTVIDQQKYINRLIIMMDFMLGAGAKGVLMVPEGSIPDGTSPEQFAKKWVSFNGVVVYVPHPTGAKPEQVYANSQSAAGEKMLSLQLQLFKEISGVNDAVQGQKVAGVNTASQYAQMTSNGAMSSKDYFEHFANARRIRDKKIVKVFQQYWDKPRYVNVSGSDYENLAYQYDPEKSAGGEYDVVIGKSGNSPVYRAQMDEYLFQFLQGGQIDLSLFLEHTSLPFAQKLKQSLAERQEASMEDIQSMTSDPQAQQMMKNVDPQTQEMFNKTLQV